MERRVAAAVFAVFLAPVGVGIAVNLFTPWLLGNAGMIGSILTSPWLPWGLYAVMGVPWFYYWFVVVARRNAPQTRLQRINDLFTEQQAIRTVVMPATSPSPPRGMERRVARFRGSVGRVLGSDPAYRAWLDACWQGDLIRADTGPETPEQRHWRAAIIVLTNQSDAILRDLQSRLIPVPPRSPRTSTRDR